MAVGLLLMTAACGGDEEPRSDVAAATRTSSVATATTSSPRPSATPSPTATLDPDLVSHECEPVADEALVSQLAATILPPYNDPFFALNGVVSLRTNYEGDSWTYLAARVGPTMDGKRQMVGVWALPDGQPPVGLKMHIDSDGDGGFDLEIKEEAAFSDLVKPGPFYWNDDRTRVADCALAASGATSVTTAMTLAHYEQLRPNETTLDQLYSLVGDRVCEETSEATVGGVTTLGLTCRGEGQVGANAVLIFQRGVLVSKAQAGLA